MLAASKGWQVVYAPRAISIERAWATLQDEAARRSGMVAGRVQALPAVIPPLPRSQPRLARTRAFARSSPVGFSPLA